PVKLVPRTLKRDVIQEHPAEALETVILPLRRSFAVRLTASVLEGIAAGPIRHCGMAVVFRVDARFHHRTSGAKGISSSRSRWIDPPNEPAGLSCFGLMLSERYLRPLFLEVRTQPDSQYSVPSMSSEPL